MGNRHERAPAGGPVVFDDLRERSRPGAALRGERGAVDLEEAAVDATTSFGHAPVGETLIEVAGQKSNQRWMDPRVGVEVVHGADQVAMPDRRDNRRRRQIDGAIHRLQARIPEPVDGPSFLARAIVALAEHGQRRPCARRHIGAKAPQGRGLFEDPRELTALRDGNAVQHEGPPQVEA